MWALFAFLPSLYLTLAALDIGQPNNPIVLWVVVFSLAVGLLPFLFAARTQDVAFRFSIFAAALSVSFFDLLPPSRSLAMELVPSFGRTVAGASLLLLLARPSKRAETRRTLVAALGILLACLAATAHFQPFELLIPTWVLHTPLFLQTALVLFAGLLLARDKTDRPSWMREAHMGIVGVVRDPWLLATFVALFLALAMRCFNAVVHRAHPPWFSYFELAASGALVVALSSSLLGSNRWFLPAAVRWALATIFCYIASKLISQAVPISDQYRELLLIALFFASIRLGRLLVKRMFMPDGGHLLDAVLDARVAFEPRSSLLELGEVSLQTLHRAFRCELKSPTLCVRAPDRSIKLEAFSAVMSEAPFPSILAEEFGHRGAWIHRADLRRASVRDTERRPLLRWCEEHDVEHVFPLFVESQLEGVFLIPGSLRTSHLNEQESRSLERYIESLAQSLALHQSILRSTQRHAAMAKELNLWKDRAEGAVPEAASEKQIASPPVARLSFGLEYAYSPAMSSFLSRCESLALLDIPLWIEAPWGVPVASLGAFIHARSPRAEASLRILMASELQLPEIEEAIYSAEGGTMVLCDPLALGEEALLALAQVIATKRMRHLGRSSAQKDVADLVAQSDVDVRFLLVSFSQESEGIFERLPKSLVHRLEQARLRYPNLQERPQDIPSIAYRILTQRARAQNEEPLGISNDALRVLSKRHYLADESELVSLIVASACVARMRGEQQRIERRDVEAVLANETDHSEPAKATSTEDDRAAFRQMQSLIERDGSLDWVKLEFQLLTWALEKSGGQRNHAAELLGMSRARFDARLRSAS